MLPDLDPKLAALYATLLGALGPFVKIAIDFARMTFPMIPGHLLPMIAVVVSITLAMALLVVYAAPPTPQTIITGVLAGFWAGVQAVGITAIQEKAVKEQDLYTKKEKHGS